MKKIEVKIIKKWKEGDAQGVEEKQVSSQYVFCSYAKAALRHFQNFKKINEMSITMQGGKRCIHILFERQRLGASCRYKLCVEGVICNLKTIIAVMFDYIHRFREFVQHDEKELNKLYVIKFAGGFTSTFYAENDEEAVKERENYLNRNEAKIFERERLVATIPAYEGLTFYTARKTWKSKDLTTPRSLCKGEAGKTFEEMEVKNEDN